MLFEQKIIRLISKLPLQLDMLPVLLTVDPVLFRVGKAIIAKLAGDFVVSCRGEFGADGCLDFALVQ